MTGREKGILRRKKNFPMFSLPARNLFCIFVKQEKKYFYECDAINRCDREISIKFRKKISTKNLKM